MTGTEDAAMPSYEYRCPVCGPFVLLRAVAARAEPAVCPGCGQPSLERLLSAPALSLPGAASRAAARNERACHHPGCAASAGERPSGGAAVGRRPWMLG
ncbi:FmdB family zinc ribbon protein [Chromobacterium alkanivorans]